MYTMSMIAIDLVPQNGHCFEQVIEFHDLVQITDSGGI